MNGFLAIRLLFLVVLVVGCFGCPNHCLCYVWNGLERIDCIRRNLFNTFLTFSHKTQILDLSFNVITILHGNEFLDANLRNLKDINLSNNQIHQIDKFSFNGLQFLQNVDLSHNSIEYLNQFTFKQNHNLKSLNVSFNPLSLKKYESFLNSNIRFLDLSYCRFEFITKNTFSHLENLRILNLTKNHIREIELEFINGFNDLYFIDLTKNNFPCNDQSKALFRLFLSRKIQFRSLCERSQQMTIVPTLKKKETKQLESQPFANFDQNATAIVSTGSRDHFKNLANFFQRIPSFYAAIFGVHFGILIGSLATYICLKKIINKYKTNMEGTYEGRECHDLNYSLIPFNVPPGTPPSPYHSTFSFSSN